MSISAEMYDDNKRFLWGLCYRMTGDAYDAEDIVQETFVRAVETSSLDMDQPLRPWLVRVAMNLCRDHLRQRRRRQYDGPWLPSPLPTGEARPLEPALFAAYGKEWCGRLCVRLTEMRADV